MMLYDDCFIPPEHKPDPVCVELDDELILIRCRDVQLGLEASQEMVQVVIDTLEFISLSGVGAMESEEVISELSRILRGKE